MKLIEKLASEAEKEHNPTAGYDAFSFEKGFEVGFRKAREMAVELAKKNEYLEEDDSFGHMALSLSPVDFAILGEEEVKEPDSKS